MIWSATTCLLAGIIIACLLVAIITDLANRIIPNRIVLIVLFCSIALRLMSGPEALLTSLLSAAAVLGVVGLLASYDLLGWGDAKLITAVTFAVPADHVIAMLFAITLAGGLLSCLYLILRFILRRATVVPTVAERAVGHLHTLRELTDRERARIRANEPMPYAFAVLAGVAFGLATG